MILRPYQRRLVDKAIDALSRHRNTLAVACTGAGKTICLSAIAQKIGGKQLILQHRQELVQQNLKKFKMINPNTTCSLWTASTKSFKGDTTFAMVQSLAGHISAMPRLDIIIADEAHHCAAPTWRSIIEAAKAKNPDVMIAGFTATPSRTDKKSLRQFFDNICDVITLKELVALGFLVPPKAYVIDTAGTADALAKIRTVSDFGDQAEVADILNTDAVNSEIIRHWREKAKDRPTVIFCSTVDHAEDVAKTFNAEGISAACVHGDLSPGERQRLLDQLTEGRIRVITNCMVLTEGWDYPPVSCVILLRRSSDKSPLIQMVGRGLRTVNQNEFPGVDKRDCIVMDFGQSLLTHGDLYADTTLGNGDTRSPGEACTKTCPDCGIEIPLQIRECPVCGYIFSKQKDDVAIEHVDLTEMDILNASPFRYCDLFDSGKVMVASGFEAWAGVVSSDCNTWYGVGRIKHGRLQILYKGDRLQAISSADDFMRAYESEDSVKKTRRWLDDPASPKQVELLSNMGYDLSQNALGRLNISKYAAMCHLSFQFSRNSIERILGV